MYRLCVLLGLTSGWVMMLTSLLLAQSTDQYAIARAKMVDTVLKKGWDHQSARPERDERHASPRVHAPEFRNQAYYDKAVPIGQSQNDQQPTSWR